MYTIGSACRNKALMSMSSKGIDAKMSSRKKRGQGGKDT